MITSRPHRFGGIAYRLGNREIGHVHGDGLVDIPFPTRVRNELVATGQAVPHHILPESGWISLYIRNPEDVEKAIALLRKSYDLVNQRIAARARESGGPPDGSQL